MRRIVVGVDGSDNSRRALEWAAAEARKTDRELVIVHAWTLPAAAHGSLAVPNFDPLGTRNAYRDAARATVASLLAKVDVGGLRLDVQVVEGHAGDAVVRAGRHASMIVVGHRGRRRLAQLVLGSTAQHVSRHSPVPVVVVPDRIRTQAVAA